MVITPIELPETQGAVKVFPTNYEFTDKRNRRMVRYLNDSYEVVEIPHGQDMVKRLAVFLNSDNDYQLRFDIGLAGVSTEDIITWASEHPLLIDDSGYIQRKNNKLGPASYSILLERQLTKHKHSVDKEIMQAYTKFCALPDEQKQAVAVFFGVNPTDLEAEDLDNKMVSITGGVLTIVAENRTRFLTQFTSLFDEVSLNFKAAVLCGVIVQMSEGIYTIANNSYVLGDESMAITTLRKREDLYSIVCRDLHDKGMIQTGLVTDVEFEEEEDDAPDLYNAPAFNTPIEISASAPAAEAAEAPKEQFPPAPPAPKGAKAVPPAGEFKAKQ